MDQYKSISEMFSAICKRFPDSVAYSCMGKTLTFSELDKLSYDFAAYLQHHTMLAPGDRMAVQLPNLLQYPIVLFGALKAGVVIVNTNPLYTGHELEHQLVDSGAKVLVVLSNLAKAAEEVIDKTQIQQVITTEVGDMHDFPKRQLINFVLRYVKKQVPNCHFPLQVNFRTALSLGARDSFHTVERDLEDIAFLQYTGGTTGLAKGAMLSQKNILSNTHQIMEIWEEHLEMGKEVWLAPLPLYHIYGFIMHCMVVVATGGRSVLIPNPRDLPTVVKACKDNETTAIIGLNTLFVALMRNPDFKALDFSKLKYTISGGMALAEDTWNHWRDLTGNRIVEGYGLTETSPVVTSNDPENPLPNTIGYALPHTELKVVDADGQALPNGEPGELCIKGPQVMMGYWKREEATAEILSKDGWLATGDIATIADDGYVRIVDRKKDLIIVSGFNVYPNEVEGVLVSHPEIIEAAVVGIPDEESGEAVKAYVVLAEGSDLDDDSIKKWCKESLTGYKVPRQYEFRNELPKTNVGKVLRRQLRDES